MEGGGLGLCPSARLEDGGSARFAARTRLLLPGGRPALGRRVRGAVGVRVTASETASLAWALLQKA